MISQPIDDVASVDEPIRDRGGVLVLVLVTGVIATLFVLPILYYITNVARANQVVSNKAEAVELAEGGIWVALSNQGDLFDLCDGGPLVSSLDEVETTCEVIATETLRDPSEVPFDAGVVQADATLPAGVGSNPYVNPNTAANPAAWSVSPDWTATPTAGTIWMPQLPVRPTSNGADRIKDMTPGAQDSNYASCQVFFPGTFTDPVVIDEPTYFTSGVYYFEQPIIIRAGADVVVGRGSEIGCTNDFEAGPGVVGGPPIPLNMSGNGGTFVLGDSARIEIDDDGTDPIRFIMNQRYVADDETGVAASAGVSIVTVNGAHAPFAPTESLGDALDVPGIISVPASTIGIDGNPLAVNEGYVPSQLTPAQVQPSGQTPVLDLTVEHGENVDVVISGYVSVPQGSIALGSASPASSSVSLIGGVLAGEFFVDPAGAPAIDVRFENPIGQKRIRIVSEANSRFSATSIAIVQVNESGSIAINSWVVQ